MFISQLRHLINQFQMQLKAKVRIRRGRAAGSGSKLLDSKASSQRVRSRGIFRELERVALIFQTLDEDKLMMTLLKMQRRLARRV